MKERYIWICSWDKGQGKNRKICLCEARKLCKTKEEAIRLARKHESKFGHNSVHVLKQIKEKKMWLNKDCEYAGKNKSYKKISRNILYNYYWAICKVNFLGIEVAVISKNALGQNHKLIFDKEEASLKLLNNKEIYKFCKKHEKFVYFMDSRMWYYNDINGMKEDMLITTLGNI